MNILHWELASLYICFNIRSQHQFSVSLFSNSVNKYRALCYFDCLLSSPSCASQMGTLLFCSSLTPSDSAEELGHGRHSDICQVSGEKGENWIIGLCYAKSLQSCPTLCDPIDGSPPGSPVPGILQARTLEWVAISFSNARKWKVKVKSLSRVRLLATPWTAVYQAPPSMGFSKQEYWSGVPSPSLE